MNKLHRYRSNYVNDQYNKIASYIIDYCQDNDIGTIVVGLNKQWKSEIKLRKADKQNFIEISHTALIKKIKAMAENFQSMLSNKKKAIHQKLHF